MAENHVMNFMTLSKRSPFVPTHRITLNSCKELMRKFTLKELQLIIYFTLRGLQWWKRWNRWRRSSVSEERGWLKKMTISAALILSSWSRESGVSRRYMRSFNALTLQSVDTFVWELESFEWRMHYQNMRYQCSTSTLPVGRYSTRPVLSDSPLRTDRSKPTKTYPHLYVFSPFGDNIWQFVVADEALESIGSRCTVKIDEQNKLIFSIFSALWIWLVSSPNLDNTLVEKFFDFKLHFKNIFNYQTDQKALPFLALPLSLWMSSAYVLQNKDPMLANIESDDAEKQ